MTDESNYDRAQKAFADAWDVLDHRQMEIGLVMQISQVAATLALVDELRAQRTADQHR